MDRATFLIIARSQPEHGHAEYIKSEELSLVEVLTYLKPRFTALSVLRTNRTSGIAEGWKPLGREICKGTDQVLDGEFKCYNFKSRTS